MTHFIFFIIFLTFLVWLTLKKGFDLVQFAYILRRFLKGFDRFHLGLHFEKVLTRFLLEGCF